jgi:hypothetical protein
MLYATTCKCFELVKEDCVVLNKRDSLSSLPRQRQLQFPRGGGQFMGRDLDL